MSSVVTEERYKHLADFLRSGLGSTSVYPPGFTVNQKHRLRQQAAGCVVRPEILCVVLLARGHGKKPLSSRHKPGREVETYPCVS